MEQCYHCGDTCEADTVKFQDKLFCCQGCKTVYEILNESDLSYYYELENQPGVSPSRFDGKFDFLKNESIVKKLIEFDEQGTQVVNLLIPSIHCSSCIWVLENLNKLHQGVVTSQLDFPKKTARITYATKNINLHELCLLLSKIGYEPYISLEDSEEKKDNTNRQLIYKLGVAGFAFGNIMFLSFPEYFEVNEFWLEKFKHTFRWLMFAFSLPVVFYAGNDYLISAYKGLRSKLLNIDVPIAVGILVLFMRSSIEILMDNGSGFFDSLAGLVFFLLVGKFFQQRTYNYLSFERDYKSYFPIAVTQIVALKNGEFSDIQTPVKDLHKGDRVLIRNSELLPVDGILIKGNALIDYSFVSGESRPVSKVSGDQLFAGGKQQAGTIEVEVLKPVDQSYLTQLWSNKVFSKNYKSTFETLTNTISKKFTISLFSIAIITALVWIFIDKSQALNVFTAVLIVACPCAIALAAPFTLGNLLRIYGRYKFYLKDSLAVEKLANIDTVVFDKTGTLTSSHSNAISYEGITLNNDEKVLLNSTLRASNHPLSRSLYNLLKDQQIKPLDHFEESVGQGIYGALNNHTIKIGAYDFVNSAASKNKADNTNQTTVHISINNTYKGYFMFYNEYRSGLTSVFNAMQSYLEIIILSGDNDGERERLKNLIGKDIKMHFNQKPEDKLNFINNLQEKGKNVLMIGDGLNDAGALAQSNIGISISENTNIFSPACDAILDAAMFAQLPKFLRLSKQGIRIIKYAFIFSLFYNLIGLGFAITGHLAPVVAAILMPLSSISIVIFTSVATQIVGKNLTLKKM